MIQDGNDYKTQQREDLHRYLKEQFWERDGSSTMLFDLDGLWALWELYAALLINDGLSLLFADWVSSFNFAKIIPFSTYEIL